MAIERREFLRGTVLLAGSAFAFVQEIRGHAMAALTIEPQAGAEPILFEPLEIVTLAAVASQIIPTTDQPGATEVGVAVFINSRVRQDPDLMALYRNGIAALNRNTQRVFGQPFHRLMAQQKKRALQDLEQEAVVADNTELDHSASGSAGSDFFSRVRQHTIEAFYTSPLGVYVASGRRATKTHAFCTANEGVPDVDKKPEI